MNLPSISELKARVGQLVNRAVVKPVQNYLAPTQNVRAIDVAREAFNPQTYKTLGKYVGQAANQVANSGNQISRGLENTSYFKPTANVRPRDFVREIPGGINEAAKMAAQGLTRFGISALEAPGAIKSGQASGRFYNTPVGRVNSFQSEAQNRVNRGDSLLKSIGNPALDTILGGSDFGAVVNPALRTLRLMKGAPAELRNLSSDLLAELTRKGIKYTDPVRDVLPEHWQKAGVERIYNQDGLPAIFPDLSEGKRFAGKVFQRGIDEVTQDPRFFIRTERLVPEQVVERGGYTPQSKLFQSLQNPGLTIKDVSGDIPPSPFAMGEGRLRSLGPEPSVNDHPLLSGRTPIAGVNDHPKSAIQTARGELNVNNLELPEDQKFKLNELGKNENPQTMSNQSVIDAAKSADPLTSPITMGQTLDETAQGLATRQQAVAQMKQFSAMQKSGAPQEELERMALETAKASKVAASVGTDAGRKLQAQNILASEFDSPMQKVFKLLNNAGLEPEQYAKQAANIDFENPAQVVKFYRSLVKPTFGEWLDVVRYNSMLSSPLTQIVNIGSNVVGSGAIRPIIKTLTGGVDFLGTALGGGPRKQFAGEGIAHSKGYWSNVGKGFNDFTDVMAGRGDMSTIDNQHISVATGPVTKGIENTLSFPSRLLEGMDRFFMAMTEGGERAALNYRQSKGIKVSNLDQQVTDEAKKVVFRGDLMGQGQGTMLNAIDWIPTKILEARNSDNPIVRYLSKFTLPFVSTPTNILKQGFESIPGIGATTIPGAANKSEQIAKQIFGSAVFLGAATMFASGRTTWGEPTNQKQKNEFRAAGMQPYSVKIGDTWYAYNKLHPMIAFPIALVAAISDAQESKKLDDDQVDTILSTVAKYGQFFSDQSYMKSMGEFLNMAKGGESSIASQIGNYGQQLVPFRALGGWITRMIDDVQRKVDPSASFLEKQAQLLMLNIPGMSDNVPARLDQLGNEIKSQNPVLNSFSPVRSSTEDPLMKGFYDQHQTELKDSREQAQLKTMLERGQGAKSMGDAKAGPQTDTDKYLKAYGFDSLIGPAKSTDTFEGALAKAERERDLVKMITDPRIPDEVQDQVIKNLGMNETDVMTLELKSMTNEVAAPFVYKMLNTGTTADLKTAIQNDLLTNGMLDEMFKQGIIDEATRWKTRDFIKAYKTKIGLLKGPKGRKAPKAKAIKFKTSLKTFNTKTTAVKKPTVTYKPIKFNPPAMDLKPFKVK